MRIYLDMCCFNRPYDDQSQLRISLESQAKLHIQELIKEAKLDLVTSYVLQYENSRNRDLSRRYAIERFVLAYRKENIDVAQDDTVSKIAESFMETGIKEKDAYHLSCAIIGDCEYFITTDDRILRHQTDKIRIINPTEFIRLEG